MPADEPQIFFRAFSGQRPDYRGALRARAAGNGFDESKLSREELRYEFDLHCDQNNRKRTALVSVSDRLVDTIARAFNKYYDDDEEPNEVWIAFIDILGDHSDVLPHPAEALAKRCGHPKPPVFRHEYLFEWEIPEEFFHLVTIEKLLSSGLDMGRFCGLYNGKRKWQETDRIEATSELRRRMEEILFTRYSVDDVGEFAWSFGPEVAQEVALQLWADCLDADEEETRVFEYAIEEWMMFRSQDSDSDDESEW